MAKGKRTPPRKGRNFAQELEARRTARDHIIKMWSLQLGLDVMTAVLNDLEGMGAKRLTRVSEEFNRRLPEYMRALAKDPEADYLRVKIDQQQRQIFGPGHLTWPERYVYWEE